MEVPNNPTVGGTNLNLALTLRIFSHAKPQQQYDDAEEVRHVAAKTKDVHGSSV